MSNVAHTERFFLDLEKGFLRDDETWGKVELVVWARGETPNVRDATARYLKFPFAPMKQIAAF